MIKGIKFASIPVRDQDRALAFWRDQVGLAVATDQPMGKQRWIELRIPGADTRLVLFTPDGHENRIGTDQNVVFWTDDVEKTWKELSSKGVTFSAPPKKEPSRFSEAIADCSRSIPIRRPAAKARPSDIKGS